MDDDYTLTAEEVRQGFVFGQPDGSSDARAAAFDRWLENLLAETWDEGASDYYWSNPYRDEGSKR